ncbi:MAG: c-type cytochrome [Rhodothermales bacterium]
MKTWMKPLCVLGVAVILFAPVTVKGQAPADSLPPGITISMVQKGNALFHGKGLCVNCHGSDAQGLIGPDLTDDNWLQAKGSFLSILQIILMGISLEESTRGVAMPPRGGSLISDTDVQAVAAYVWSLSHPDEARVSLPPGVTQALVKRGHRVFEGAGKCATCHGANAAGRIGPDLTDASWLHAKGSYLDIVSQIQNGVSLERSTRGVPMPPKGGSNLSDEEVHAVAAYVWYISHQQQE